MLEVARQIIERDGVLAGLNLREVADRAEVTRALIYQYFGDRQGLLRAALGEQEWFGASVFTEQGRRKPFHENRMDAMRTATEHARFLQLEVLRVIDRDPDVRLIKRLPEVLESLERYQAEGELTRELDPVAVLLVTGALYRGWAILREQFAAEVGLEVGELDRETLKVFDAMLRAVQ